MYTRTHIQRISEGVIHTHREILQAMHANERRKVEAQWEHRCSLTDQTQSGPVAELSQTKYPDDQSVVSAKGKGRRRKAGSWSFNPVRHIQRDSKLERLEGQSQVTVTSNGPLWMTLYCRQPDVPSLRMPGASQIAR